VFSYWTAGRSSRRCSRGQNSKMDDVSVHTLGAVGRRKTIRVSIRHHPNLFPVATLTPADDRSGTEPAGGPPRRCARADGGTCGLWIGGAGRGRDRYVGRRGRDRYVGRRGRDDDRSEPLHPRLHGRHRLRDARPDRPGKRHGVGVRRRHRRDQRPRRRLGDDGRPPDSRRAVVHRRWWEPTATAIWR
jgi:hypothetical protein